MTLEDLLENVRSHRGTPNGWPACLTYNVTGNQAMITMINGFEKKDFRRFDSWGMAFVDEAERKVQRRVTTVSFILPKENIDDCKPDFEAFRRRVSFLNINNTDKPIAFQIVRNGVSVPLDGKDSLFNRPDDETVRSLEGIEGRRDDTPGRLEKDFQTFLFGNDRGQVENTNERLAILGEEFFNLKKKGIGLIRDFPTGVFRGSVKEENRILPTEYIDGSTGFRVGKGLALHSESRSPS